MTKYFSKNILKIVIVFVLVVIFWLFAMTMIDKPAQNECLYITFVGKNFDDTSFEDFLEEYTKINSDQQLREIAVSSVTDPTDYNSSIALTVRAIGEADFMIYEEEFCSGVDANFPPLSEELLSLFSEYETYDVDGVPYGIKIPNNENLSKYYKGTNTCYVFITGISENMAGLNGVGNANDDVALITLQYLLGE